MESNWMSVCLWVNVLKWILEVLRGSLILASCPWYELVANLQNTYIKQKWILQSIETGDKAPQNYKTESICLCMLSILIVKNRDLMFQKESATKNKEFWNKKEAEKRRKKSRKNKVKILAVGKLSKLEKVLEIGEKNRGECLT